MNDFLKKDRDFQKVYRRKNIRGNRAFTLFIDKNKQNVTRMGFTLTKKIGNAVTRNKIKRRLREIYRKSNVKQGYDIVLVVKKQAVDLDYKSLEKSFYHVLRKGNLLNETNNATHN